MRCHTLNGIWVVSMKNSAYRASIFAAGHPQALLTKQKPCLHYHSIGLHNKLHCPLLFTPHLPILSVMFPHFTIVLLFAILLHCSTCYFIVLIVLYCF
jgi:hypothetical protein